MINPSDEKSENEIRLIIFFIFKPQKGNFLEEEKFFCTFLKYSSKTFACSKSFCVIYNYDD